MQTLHCPSWAASFSLLGMEGAPFLSGTLIKSTAMHVRHNIFTGSAAQQRARVPAAWPAVVLGHSLVNHV
jgi:hypothetical protein